MQVLTYTCYVTPYLLRSCTHSGFLDDPMLPICVYATWMPPTYEKTRKKPRNRLRISSMEPTSSKSKVLTEEWKIFFFVFLLSLDNIVGLFSRLNIKSCTKVNTLNPTLNSLLRKFTSNLLWIQIWIHLNEFSASKSLYWKQSKRDQQKFILIFLLKLRLLFCFICVLKILNQEATISKETIGLDFWMTMILSYIKPRSRITIVSYHAQQELP